MPVNMTEKELFALRYPIGEYSPKENYTSNEINDFINAIEALPGRLNQAVSGLTDSQLDTPYRPGGWSLRQVIHHIADSHINSYTRFKLTLTEDTPAIRPYFEDRWAELPEAKSAPVELSLPLIDYLHKRWTVMLKNITGEQLKRRLYHPETKQEMTIEQLMHLYAWHSDHHLAHVNNLIVKEGWK